MKQICRKSDYCIQAVQVFDDVFSNSFLRSTTEQYTMRQQYSNASVIFVHMINHVFHKCEIRLSFRCQFSCSGIAWVIFKLFIRRPFQRIRRIAHLYCHFDIAVFVIFQCIAFINIKILPVNAVHNHVHTTQVVRCRIQLLSIEMTDFSCCQMFLYFQKHRSRTAGAVTNRLCLIQSQCRKCCAELRRTCRSKELSAFLSRIRCE